MAKKVVVVGGINVDITGAPRDKLRLGDSNIGAVRLTSGGVGRNIAENLSRLGFEVELIAPLGSDVYAQLHHKSCEALRIGLSYAPVFDLPSSAYLCMMDGAGDMLAGVNDMAICDAMRPENIDMRAIDEADAVVLDANLPENTLFAVAERASAPVFADPVSAAKCKRLSYALPYIFAIKPNLMEARELTGCETPEAAAERLLELGVKRAYISLGSDGMYFKDEVCAGRVKVEDVPIINATGAGDSATAAIVAGCLCGKNTANAATLACCVAAMTIQSEKAVSESVTADMIWR